MGDLMARLLFAIFALLILSAPASAAVPRDLPSTQHLDKSWSGGLHVMPWAGRHDTIRSCVAGHDNSLLVAGRAGRREMVTRLNPAGRMDKRFSRNGVLERIPVKNAELESMVGTADGKTYLVLGWAKHGRRTKGFRIARLTRSGRLDRSWGIRGIVTVNPRTLPDGGTSITPSASGILLKQFDDQGALANRLFFDGRGGRIALPDFGNVINLIPAANGGWFTMRKVGASYSIEKRDKIGSLVTVWGNLGTHSVPSAVPGTAVNANSSSHPGDLREMADGSVVASVWTADGTPQTTSWAFRLDSHGHLDVTYGDDGKVVLGTSGAVGDSGGDFTFSQPFARANGSWVSVWFASLDLDNYSSASVVPPSGKGFSESGRVDLRTNLGGWADLAVSHDGRRAFVCGDSRRKRGRLLSAWVAAIALDN